MAGTPALAVTVTKTATPTTVPSGGTVTFTITVSDCEATLFCLVTSIADDKHAPTLFECVTPAFFGGPFEDFVCTYTRTVSDPGPYPVPVTNTTTVGGIGFIGGTPEFSVTDSATVVVTVGPPGPIPTGPSSSTGPLIGGLASLGSIEGSVNAEVRGLSRISVKTGVDGDDIDKDVNSELKNGPDGDKIAAEVRNRVD
jgi:hypothetical protein